MRFTLSRTYYPREAIFGFQHELSFDDDDDDVIRRAIERDLNSLRDFLLKNFESHQALYELVSPRFLTPEYEPTTVAFNSHSSGYNKFIKDLTEREIDTVAGVIADRLIERISFLEEQYNKQYTSRLSLRLQASQPEEDALRQIDQVMSPTIILDDKVYALELKTIDGVESYQDMQKQVYEAVKNDYDAQFEAKKKLYDDQIKRLKDILEKEKAELFVEILRNSREIFTDWEFEEVGGDLYLKYKDRVTVNKVQIGTRIYEYPGELDCKEMYVSGLKVKVVPYVTDKDVIITRGFNVHFNGTRGCIGPVNGQTLIRALKELPRALRIANMNSPLNGKVRNYINSAFLSHQEDGDEMATTSNGDLGW